MKTINHLSMAQLAIFYYVIDLNGFSRAAKHLGHAKSHISQQIKSLETTLEIQLIERNTRQMSLTLAGEQLFEHAKNIMLEYERASGTIATLRHKPEGLLRLTAPSAYATFKLASILPKFLGKYPNINISLQTTGELLNLMQHKIDVAIRLTHTPPEDRIAKRIDRYRFIICASTDYINKYGSPKRPRELTQHAALIYDTETTSSHWPFILGGREIKIPVKSALACNNHETILQAALKGRGIARLPNYVAANAIKTNKLVPLLEDYYPEHIPIYAVYTQQGAKLPNVRAFIDFLLESTI